LRTVSRLICEPYANRVSVGRARGREGSIFPNSQKRKGF
jgi:hypothetical protein